MKPFCLNYEKFQKVLATAVTFLGNSETNKILLDILYFTILLINFKIQPRPAGPKGEHSQGVKIVYQDGFTIW